MDAFWDGAAPEFDVNMLLSRLFGFHFLAFRSPDLERGIAVPSKSGREDALASLRNVGARSVCAVTIICS